MSEWINVEERLPEIGAEQRVLIFVVDWFRGGKFQQVSNRWESGFSNLLHGQKVTHWMPLPEPPESRSREESMSQSVNYMQRVGNSKCIRCDFETDAADPFDKQDADMMAHLSEKHPDWQTDGGASILPERTLPREISRGTVHVAPGIDN